MSEALLEFEIVVVGWIDPVCDQTGVLAIPWRICRAMPEENQLCDYAGLTCFRFRFRFGCGLPVIFIVGN